VGDFDTVAVGVNLAAAVGHAVLTADRLVSEALDLTSRSANVGLHIADQVVGAVGVGAALDLAALTLISDPDTGTLGLARVGVGVTVDPTDRIPQAGAGAGVGHADTGAAAGWVVLRAGRPEASLGKVADLTGVTLVVRPAVVSALTVVGDLDAGAASVAGVAVGLTIDAADWVPEVKARAWLIGHADTRAAAIGAGWVTVADRLADFAAITVFVGPTLVRWHAHPSTAAIGACGVVAVAGGDVTHFATFAVVVAVAPFLSAFAIVGDPDAVAPRVHFAAAVGFAVDTADRVVGEAHNRTLGLAEIRARVANQVAGAVFVRAAFALSAFALMGNLNAGTARLAAIAVGFSVDTAHGSPDIGADAQLVALALVGDLDAVAPRVFLAATVGVAVGPAYGFVTEACDVADRLAGVIGRIADFVARAIVVGATLAFALTSVGNLDTGTLGDARVAVGSAVDTAHWIPVGGADAGLVRYADAGAAALGAVFTETVARKLFTVFACGALVIGPAELFTLTFVSDLNTSATGITGVGVGPAVDAADGLPYVGATARLFGYADTGAGAVGAG